VIEDFEGCYNAVQSRDPRFDGWFFTAVTSTGIYCRPSCPARTPLRANVRFFPTAAAAQLAGFRACKRCRPNATPGSPEWDARAQRAQTARVLIETTTLPMADVAFAAGFSSIRQFNDTVRAVFASSPSQLRSRVSSGARPAGGSSTALVLRLPFRQPLCPDNLFGHLAATAVPGVEEVRGATYRRTLRLAHGPGIVELTPTPEHILCRAVLTDLRDLTTTISRCRWLLDLDADPTAIDGQLGSDPTLGPIIEKAPGRRVPRCVDGAELAVRAVLGQQVSTAAARTHAARMVARHGDPVTDTGGGLTHLFPTAETLLDVDAALPASRRRTLSALVGALADGRVNLGPGCDRTEVLSVLAGIPGIGPWTTQVIAMRALGDPDAFPVSDLGVQRGAALLGLSSSASDLLRHATRWRPWRAYAVQYLWAATDHRVNGWPPSP
jgi:AraC family transcriptional regulator of adaptative response / DNA-3-methyladenine glycosylase II